MDSWHCIFSTSLEARAHRDPFSCLWLRLPLSWAAYLALNWPLKALEYVCYRELGMARV